MRDRGLIDQDRIQKMHRHSAMLWTPQHQLECKIHQRTDADCHASLANRFLAAFTNHSQDHGRTDAV